MSNQERLVRAAFYQQFTAVAILGAVVAALAFYLSGSWLLLAAALGCLTGAGYAWRSYRREERALRDSAS